MRIVVIGCGLGGLSTAIRLRAAGHDVTIIDKQDHPGGIAQVYRHDGFTFDAGPPVITAPWLIQELFDLAGKRTASYVTLVSLEPLYTIRFEDGSVFHYSGLAEPLARELRRFHSADIRAPSTSARSRRVFSNRCSPSRSARSSRPRDAAPALGALLRDRAYRSVAEMVDAQISDARLRRVFTVPPLFIGGDPARTPGVYAALQTIEQRWGVWYPMGGTGALVAALTHLFTEMGGTLRLGHEAMEIIIAAASRRATGVRLASGEILKRRCRRQ